MSLLEPCAGGGALVDAILARFREIGSGSVTGLEIDEGAFQEICARLQDSCVVLRQADFLTAQVEDLGQYDAVIANPPFTRNHHIDRTERIKLKSSLKDFSITGAPGLWVYFLLASIKFLKPGGKLAFIVPGAMLFADYARPVLDRLLECFETVELISIAGEVLWDGDAQERAALVLASGYGTPAKGAVLTSRAFANTNNGYSSAPPQRPLPLLNHTLLGEVATLEIGVVTGCNRLFLLSHAACLDLGVGWGEITPIVSRSRHVSGLAVRREDLDSLAVDGEPTYLLTPKSLTVKGTKLRSHFASVGLGKRRRTRWFAKRDPWWAVQLGKSPDAVFTYMNHTGPRMALVEDGITATNTLHKVRFFDRSEAQMRLACVSMLTSYTQLHAERIGRVYGGGVLKFELKDARRLPLLLPTEPIDVSVFHRIDTALRSGAPAKARDLADEALMPMVCPSSWKSELDLIRQMLRQERLSRGVAL